MNDKRKEGQYLIRHERRVQSVEFVGYINYYPAAPKKRYRENLDTKDHTEWKPKKDSHEAYNLQTIEHERGKKYIYI